eukprot:2854276-Rhodomonas_salina.1
MPSSSNLALCCPQRSRRHCRPEALAQDPERPLHALPALHLDPGPGAPPASAGALRPRVVAPGGRTGRPAHRLLLNARVTCPEHARDLGPREPLISSLP